MFEQRPIMASNGDRVAVQKSRQWSVDVIFEGLVKSAVRLRRLDMPAVLGRKGRMRWLETTCTVH